MQKNVQPIVYLSFLCIETCVQKKTIPQNGEIDHSIYCYGQHRLTATLDETPKYKHSVLEELYFNW